MKIISSRYLLIFLIFIGFQLVDGNISRLVAQNTLSPNQDFRSFFETGRTRSEDVRLFQRPPDGIIPVRETLNSWQFVIFEEGNVSFWIPPGILIQEKIELETPVGLVNFRTLASSRENRRYMAAYADALTEEQIKNSQVLFKTIKGKVTSDDKFKLTQERSVSLDKYPGQEFTLKTKTETIVMRIYLVNNRVYALGVRYANSEPQPRETRAFLNALQLLNTK
ncbi:hypothetical protein [Aphanothece sacrum]|uniref:Uncharacterized protein n=1 Tax=Aphanothece sacrum FPU1 TaxID=1920663 RepID=A0A401IL15_APHSA|nr:hypothetical protein [Aphanothece sacrum]GBF81935.1 hypothetical protein AsFPU1_3358 [Aphanothece sacrum FPU1]GBF83564.1 hypothetical protein AsFPU3_0607 [Aphanothece sacrum FPU3]